MVWGAVSWRVSGGIVAPFLDQLPPGTTIADADAETFQLALRLGRDGVVAGFHGFAEDGEPVDGLVGVGFAGIRRRVLPAHFWGLQGGGENAALKGQAGLTKCELMNARFPRKNTTEMEWGVNQNAN
jgi:hypothetical protein